MSLSCAGEKSDCRSSEDVVDGIHVCFALRDLVEVRFGLSLTCVVLLKFDGEWSLIWS